MKTKKVDTLSKLVPAFYNLAILDFGLNMVGVPMLKVWAKEEQKKIRNLKRRGIAVVEIRDKGTIKTYHPSEGVENMLNEFVKKNNKYTWEKEVYGGIKTGKYILTRGYRKYYKKRDDDEEDCCEHCGRPY